MIRILPSSKKNTLVRTHSVDEVLRHFIILSNPEGCHVAGLHRTPKSFWVSRTAWFRAGVRPSELRQTVVRRPSPSTPCHQTLQQRLGRSVSCRRCDGSVKRWGVEGFREHGNISMFQHWRGEILLPWQHVQLKSFRHTANLA